jgi:hypothetical protein
MGFGPKKGRIAWYYNFVRASHRLCFSSHRWPRLVSLLMRLFLAVSFFLFDRLLLVLCP